MEHMIAMVHLLAFGLPQNYTPVADVVNAPAQQTRLIS
jgi:hypothetical protein